MTTPALQRAVRRAHEVFGGHKAPNGPLNVCTSCCIPEELEREMRTWPLRMLTARHFYQYCTGAMADLVQPAAEVRYLLPRWLELVAAGEETHHSVELNLDRVGRCPAGSFTMEESSVLDEFMLAYFDHHLNGADGCGCGSDPLSLLIMADAGGLALTPLLHHWTAHPGPASTVQFVRSTYWDFWPEQSLSNPFASDRDRLQAIVKDWMLAPATKAAFTAKLLNPDFLAHVTQVRCNHGVPLALMVEAVFDALSH
ncbi:hypothetical protein [Piscinibacter sp. XHJ-5]|uniref:hypothetical protein n=1 Tax=Piscinibacter sp. XHJ-5 TaxID=3037797 RepID=UPI002453522A|nr:hypothetical protein [Piscinibacter sp. XHJ-5]